MFGKKNDGMSGFGAVYFALMVIGFFISLNAAEATQNSRRELIDCNVIFEQRKSEILRGIEQIDEQQQALQALQSATQAMLDQKEAALKKREGEVNATLALIEEKEQRIKRILKRNEELLKEIKVAKDDKIAETYAKMKDSKAAPIIENLPDSEAATILFSLESKDMGKILSKMTPARAAELTSILQKGPPFNKDKDGVPSAPGATNQLQNVPQIGKQQTPGLSPSPFQNTPEQISPTTASAQQPAGTI